MTLKITSIAKIVAGMSWTLDGKVAEQHVHSALAAGTSDCDETYSARSEIVIRG